MVYGTTAYNRSVYASPPLAARATKNRSRPTAFVRFFSATFCQPWSCYASPYSGWQNVIYSRNVMQNPLRGLCITWRGLRPSYAASAARTSHNSGFTPCRSAGRKRPSARHVVKPAPRYVQWGLKFV